MIDAPACREYKKPAKKADARAKITLKWVPGGRAGALALHPARVHIDHMGTPVLSTHDKALQINIDAGRYGTFAEIGAGQETARWFFHVGGAAGTVAKTISAYDMAMSDAIYGHTRRYVSRERLTAMLEHEWLLLRERLDEPRGRETMFFVFADTAAAHSYSQPGDGHGWMGILFQTEPQGEPSSIIIHTRMWDADNAREQEALGILGVNLIHGAFYLRQTPVEMVGSLMDGITRDRMEVDMIKLSGPAFKGVDNRLMSLQLVQQRLTNAAIFSPDGQVMESAELLHGRSVLLERGSFRPITRVTLDMLEKSLSMMRRGGDGEEEPVVIMEMTLRNLLRREEEVDHDDFLGRLDTLRALGKTVMISNYSRFHNVTAYLRRYTEKPVVMVLGIPTLTQLFDAQYYKDIPGGVMEAFGRLFSGQVTLSVYPWKNPETGEVVTTESFKAPIGFEHLYAHLLANGRVRGVGGSREKELDVLPGDVLSRLQAGDPGWEALVPEQAAGVIKERQLFGYHSPAAKP